MKNAWECITTTTRILPTTWKLSPRLQSGGIFYSDPVHWHAWQYFQVRYIEHRVRLHLFSRRCVPRLCASTPPPLICSIAMPTAASPACPPAQFFTDGGGVGSGDRKLARNQQSPRSVTSSFFVRRLNPGSSMLSFYRHHVFPDTPCSPASRFSPIMGCHESYCFQVQQPCRRSTQTVNGFHGQEL